MALPTNQICRLKPTIIFLGRGFKCTGCLKKVTPTKFKGKTSSHEWLTRQLNDPYVKMALKENYRCRSAYKLIEIDNKHKILRPTSVVVDCGAAPGSWSQVAHQRAVSNNMNTGSSEQSGAVIGVDLQDMEPIDGVILFPKSDFTTHETQAKIVETLNGRMVDVVLSDMAPSATGNKETDHDNICKLCMSVLEFSSKLLGSGGHVLCKLWDGQDREKIVSVMKRMFTNVHIIKPKASRSDSAEIFLLGTDFFLRKKSK